MVELGPEFLRHGHPFRIDVVQRTDLDQLGSNGLGIHKHVGQISTRSTGHLACSQVIITLADNVDLHPGMLGAEFFDKLLLKSQRVALGEVRVNPVVECYVLCRGWSSNSYRDQCSKSGNAAPDFFERP